MNIANISGVTQAQRDALLALGAVDRPGMSKLHDSTAR
jgi:hypothetical protein